MSKALKILLGTIKTVIYAVLLLFILLVCLQRFSGNKLSFFSYRMFAVVSESMKPKYVIGDVLIAKEVAPSEIKKGDVISYLGEYGQLKDKVITHQVVGIEKDANGNFLFRSKGLANTIEDPRVKENQLYGVVVYKSLILSFIYKIIQSKLGFILFIIVPILVIITFEMISTMIDKRNELKAKKEVTE